MSTKEVPPGQLVNELAETMKKEGIVTPPQWAKFIKTGAHAERPPENPDWWYVRAASVLRQVYMRGPIGVQKLRNWYGGRKNRGARPERHQPAGGKIIRVCLQQLEAAGLIIKGKNGGRAVTPKGQSMLDKLAATIAPRREAKPIAKPKKAPAKKKAAPKKAGAKAEATAPEAEASAPKAATPKEAKPKAEPKAEKPKEEAKKEAKEKPVKKAAPKKEAKPKPEAKPEAKSEAKAEEKPKAEPKPEKAEEKE